MQPDIYINSVRLAEPGIAFTGLLIALLCAWAWRRLRLRQARTVAQNWMLRFFALMGIASVLGPIFGHLFYYRVGFPGKYACWVFTILASAALAQAALEHLKQNLAESTYRLLSGLNISLAAAALAISAGQRNFHWVEAHTAVTLLGLMAPLEWQAWRQWKDAGSRSMLLALPAAALSVVPHLLKWSPGVWLTYFDLGHLLLLPCLWLMLRGAERWAVAG